MRTLFRFTSQRGFAAVLLDYIECDDEAETGCLCLCRKKKGFEQFGTTSGGMPLPVSETDMFMTSPWDSNSCLQGPGHHPIASIAFVEKIDEYLAPFWSGSASMMRCVPVAVHREDDIVYIKGYLRTGLECS